MSLAVGEYGIFASFLYVPGMGFIAQTGFSGFTVNGVGNFTLHLLQPISVFQVGSFTLACSRDPGLPVTVNALNSGAFPIVSDIIIETTDILGNPVDVVTSGMITKLPPGSQ